MRALTAASLVGVAVAAGAVALLAARAARLREELRSARRAAHEAQRHAAMLEQVAVSAQAMASLEVDHVLRAVVDAVTRLGLDAADLVVLDAAGQTYRVLHHRGLPADYTEGTFNATRGVVGEVVRLHGSVVVDDYDQHPDHLEVLERQGFRCVIAVPVWAQGRIAGVLEGGTRRSRCLEPPVRDAMELLAAQAGVALENALRHEEEQRSAERMQRLEALLRDVVATAAHELRTPVTVIESNSQTLTRRWEGLDEWMRLDLVRRIAAQAQALDEVITALLDFNQLEAGLLRPTTRVVDLGDVVTTTAERLDHLFAGRQLHLAAAAGIRVEGDAALLARVVEHLLANAAKHNPEGTAVLVEVRAEGSDAIVSVTDDGAGIEPADLPHLQEPFYRAGAVNTRPTRGLGLGLASVREILDLHRTRLEVTSRPRRGASFSFRLPLARPVPRRDVAAPTAEPTGTASASAAATPAPAGRTSAA